MKTKLLLILLSLVQFNRAASAEITLVIINKSQRILSLVSNNEVIKKYHISLGRKPLGKKSKEGDERTPEGDYILDWKNPQSKYTLSIHVSYPNKQDIEQAKKRGVNPGSAIMLHGLPNNVNYIKNLFKEYRLTSIGELSEDISAWFFSKLDWTQGCIALSNNDIEEIYNLVTIPTPIKIIP